MKHFTLMDMFPAFCSPEELDYRQITLLELCAQIGIPFPAERNKSYGNWWHSLHEIGHWAVKPDWYIQYAEYLMDDLNTTWGSLEIPAGSVPGVDRDIVLPKVGRYVGGNDVIPEIGLLIDPTPGEHETRVWSLQFIKRMGWNHPFDDNPQCVASGNHFFHKPASARVWATPLINNQHIREKMDCWGLDVEKGQFRAMDEFSLPHPTPVCHQEMVNNMDAIYEYFGMEKLNAEERAYWLSFLQRRWSDSDLFERSKRQPSHDV